ncbi:hypothetical protein ABZU75_12275 [Streptosporangium sp. NPDC005286]|uniref:hypothetical protein n=1 Tax=Streptosporangium sp. NPDC005286 TaxID=3154463 RepID=UPI0033B32DF5
MRTGVWSAHLEGGPARAVVIGWAALGRLPVGEKGGMVVGAVQAVGIGVHGGGA